MDEHLRNELVAAFDLGAFPQDEQDQILIEMTQLVMESCITRAMPLLSDADASACDKILDDETTDMTSVFTFLGQHVSNFNEIVNEEVESLKTKLGKNN